MLCCSTLCCSTPRLHPLYALDPYGNGESGDRVLRAVAQAHLGRHGAEAAAVRAANLQESVSQLETTHADDQLIGIALSCRGQHPAMMI